MTNTFNIQDRDVNHDLYFLYKALRSVEECITLDEVQCKLPQVIQYVKVIPGLESAAPVLEKWLEAAVANADGGSGYSRTLRIVRLVVAELREEVKEVYPISN